MTTQVKDFARVFILGCGDIGSRVALRWQQQNGLPITGLVRSQASAERLRQQGIDALVLDLDQPPADDSVTIQAKLTLQQALIYYFAPPPKAGEQDTRMLHFLQLPDRIQKPARIIYLSTSGVYGDQAGHLIDEDTPPRPVAARAKRRYFAEQAVRQWGEAQQVPVITLRTGGIYAPDRLPLKRIRDQLPMIHEHLAPTTNRIHADDLAQACVAAANKGRAGRIYNISDGTPSNMTEYFNTIADYFGLPRPPTIDWREAEKQLSPSMLSYLRESRQLDNRRMLEELGVQLQYPDLQRGLASCRPDTNHQKMPSA
ncbi:Nucleoside-diphosphate-sugar epimerases [hydrothermal vent metagenome]|uniref:Nucleoside-diphosphate-sugar epimerases n=1 Tax=hydrothermal vent metagenome TaxID=652676 RepID=A0A3B1BKV0_9ZZZZ